MDKKLDAKIKQILQENDDIVVPRNISKGIDETLKSLINKKTINKKKVIAAASVIIFLSITPLGIKALKDMFYTYIPSTGNIISTDSTIYLLEKTINKKITNNFKIEYFHIPGLGIPSQKRKNLSTNEDYLNLFKSIKLKILTK